MTTPETESDEVFLSGKGDFDLEIVGESHYQGSLAAICGPRKEHGEELEIEAYLILENDNPHDSNAVRVDIAGKTVGYIKKEVAPILREQLRLGGHPHPDKITCNAKIVGGWSREGSRGFYGVRLDIPYQEVEASASSKKEDTKSNNHAVLLFIVLAVVICIVFVIAITHSSP